MRTTPVAAAALDGNVASVAPAWQHTCVLTTAGGVKCWGINVNGNLGIGMADGQVHDTPEDVVGLQDGVAAVATGLMHSCALTEAGGVKCWGGNNGGQLGDALACGSYCPSPVDVSGLDSGVAAITAWGSHTCALSTAGGIKCWGRNGYGQLGDGTTTDRGMPVDAIGLDSGVAAVAVGVAHTCALTTAGGVKCWGDNSAGQLGDGTTIASAAPVDVIGLGATAATVAAGLAHTCALTTAGSVKCWGANDYGQLGDGTTSDRYTGSSKPVEVVGLQGGLTAIAAGGQHTCGVTAAGTVKCWGIGGALGDGTMTTSPIPVDVLFDSDGDGCGDAQEQGGDPSLGGVRNPKDFWDFYDVWTHPVGDPGGWERNGNVGLFGDLFGVAMRFGATDDGDGDGVPDKAVNRNSDPLVPPADASGYHPAFDRGPLVGPNPWDLGPPDGEIDIFNDVLGVAAQFGHSCG